MDSENKISKKQSWLDNLQQESWQLELIISSILLLILGSYEDKIPDLIFKYDSIEGFNFAFIIAIIIPLLLFIKSNLIAHIFLRGLWIGCIGLRYISTDIDFNSFGYATKFDRYLKKKIIPFDDYIEKLEKICSIIFSYSFLMVFHFLSFSIFFTIIQWLSFYAYDLFDNIIARTFLGIVILLLLFSGILNFIDFITLGKLKKTKYISYLFYPFYRIYNLFSFAFLYRPIHYNFISNKLGRIYMLLMLPYMLLLAFLGDAINYQQYTYIPKKENSSNWVMEDNYDELRDKRPIQLASIEKLFYNENEPLKLFLRVDNNEKTNELIGKLCPDLTSYNRKGFTLRPFNAVRVVIGDSYQRNVSAEQHHSNIESSLTCISKIFEVSIDSNRMDSLDYVFYEHQNAGENGLLTGININKLTTGKHKLIIKSQEIINDTIGIKEVLEIPFFKN